MKKRLKIKNTVKLRNDTVYTLKYYKASSYEQQKYFRPGLTDRYNNFKKYF